MASRRQFLASGVPAFLQVTRRPKNILLMIADDLGLNTGAYGDPVANTPNLDRLASEGVRFTGGFCTTASCSPSRSVLLTGLHNHANGQYGLAHSIHNFWMLPNIQPSTRLLKDAGYATGVIGKLHVNTPHGFGWDYDDQRDDRNVLSMADRARRFIQNCGSRPWYLHYGFGDPHRLGAGFGNDRKYPGVASAMFNPVNIRVPSFLPDNPEVRAELAEYYQAANRLDQGAGFMLDLLRETGQLDNTLIIFLSDNGIPFANAKTNLYDAATHLPLIIRSPAQTRRGLVNNAMVSWTDIVPTILDWAGVRPPEYPLHGRSVLPVLEQENPQGWDSVFFSHTFHEVTMYFPMRGMRTRQFKYIRNIFPELEYPLATDLYSSRTWQSILRAGENALIGKRPVGLYLHRPYEELYDITRDPDEVDNLAPDPAYESTLKQLRAETHEFRTRTHDPWTLVGFYRGEPPGDSPEERTVNEILGQRKPAGNDRK